jgi:HprK-related kinase A
MKVSDLSFSELADALSVKGITLHAAPFVVHLRTQLPSVVEGIRRMYADYRLEPELNYADFHIEISRPKNLRRWLRPQVSFFHDGKEPFRPLPLNQAFPLFEWGLNWCIANYMHQNLILHAAAVEKGGRVVILPGDPGAGKSTLCAALANRGWRLLTDELTLISLKDHCVLPVPRPVSLKNASIDVIKAFEPSVIMSDLAHDTVKGTVAHMKPPAESVDCRQECVQPAWIIFPKYTAGAKARLEPESKCSAFMRIIKHAFNYSVLGDSGFHAIGKLLDECDCYDFSYSKLDDAIELFDALSHSDVTIKADAAL